MLYKAETVEIFIILAFTDFVFFMKIISLVWCHGNLDFSFDV